MLRRTFLLTSLTSLGLLAACETPVSVPRYADITFAHLDPIPVRVAKVTVVEEYRGPGSLPNVEHEFPVPPMRMAARWAQDRLRPVGESGELIYTIREASVVEVPLETSTGLTGMVTTDQAERYEADLGVLIQARNDALGITAGSETQVRRARTVAEDVTLNEREGIWYKMTEDMAADLNAQLEQAFAQYFTEFTRPGG